MATTSISITPQFGNNTVTQINCGTSSPKLGGTIDISAFPNLQEFRCNNNDITAISGYENNANLTIIQFFENKVTGSIPSLSSLNILAIFNCFQNQLTGSIPSLSGLSNLVFFSCSQNQLTGPIPSLSGLSNLQAFGCSQNQLTGSIPSLSSLNILATFNCSQNQLTGPIPNLSANTALQNFNCRSNLLTGSIPDLSNNTQLESFQCFTNQLTGFDGGSVSNTLGNFQAQNNQLTQTTVNTLLSTFDATTRTTGTRILNLGGTGNSAPSYTGGVTTTSPGSNFSRVGTLVTANVTGHGHTTGDLVTITGITQTAFQGTFSVTVTGPDQFQYTTVTSGAATGSGTATMRRTTNTSDGFRSYQNLALVTRLGGFPWNVTINFP